MHLAFLKRGSVVLVVVERCCSFATRVASLNWLHELDQARPRVFILVQPSNPREGSKSQQIMFKNFCAPADLQRDYSVFATWKGSYM